MTDAVSLEGRVALVTGASSGIGAAVARLLAGAGVHVVVNSRSSAAAGQAVADEVGGSYVQADVSDPTAARELVRRAAAVNGRLDLVVNNAATTQVIAHGDLDAATPEVWHQLYATNVVAPFVVTAAARPFLDGAPSGGCVINIGSLSGLRPTGSSVPYAVSKAALHHQTRLLAVALAPRIRVNAVAPGMVDSPWSAGWDDAKARYAEQAPLGRVATPADVAAVVVSLIRLPYVTGEVWTVDGGAGLVG